MNPHTPWTLLGMDAADFWSQHWDRKPALHRPCALPAFPFTGVAALLDALEGAALPHDFVDLKGLFGYLPRDQYCTFGQPDLARIRPLVQEQGYNLVLRGVHSYLDAPRELAREYQALTRVLVRSNLYLTHHRTRAYPLHWDTHGLLAMQLCGSKRWNLYSPCHPRPLPGQNYDRMPGVSYEGREPDMVVDVREGDVLYVPRGWAHEVVTTGECSIHITFGFHALTVHDLVENATADALGSLAMTEALRSYVDPQNVDAGQIADLVSEAVQVALRASLERLASQRERTAIPVGDVQTTTDHWYTRSDPATEQIHLKFGLPSQPSPQSIPLPQTAAPLVHALFESGALARDEAESLVPAGMLPGILKTLTEHGLTTP